MATPEHMLHAALAEVMRAFDESQYHHHADFGLTPAYDTIEVLHRVKYSLNTVIIGIVNALVTTTIITVFNDNINLANLEQLKQCPGELAMLARRCDNAIATLNECIQRFSPAGMTDQLDRLTALGTCLSNLNLKARALANDATPPMAPRAPMELPPDRPSQGREGRASGYHPLLKLWYLINLSSCPSHPTPLSICSVRAPRMLYKEIAQYVATHYTERLKQCVWLHNLDGMIRTNRTDRTKLPVVAYTQCCECAKEGKIRHSDTCKMVMTPHGVAEASKLPSFAELTSCPGACVKTVIEECKNNTAVKSMNAKHSDTRKRYKALLELFGVIDVNRIDAPSPVEEIDAPPPVEDAAAAGPSSKKQRPLCGSNFQTSSEEHTDDTSTMS